MKIVCTEYAHDLELQIITSYQFKRFVEPGFELNA